MHPTAGSICIAVSLLFIAVPVRSGDKPQPNPPAHKSVEQLAKVVSKSVVVIKQQGRDGKERGLGSGFVIDASGLIATNLHVIGEARPISVQLADGKVYPVKTVFASDRSLDLALLKIDAKTLPVVPLGDSNALKNGQAIVAIGHPEGLRYSVVSGVVSGQPKIDGKRMVQIAVPIERGNSGGPVLDRKGRVVGVVTLKAARTRNLGFAVPINELKKLLKRPNPVPMKQWVTIGRINKDEWQTVFQGSWRQRNGRIIVDGPGEGFGGRSLCLSRSAPPKLPFEIEVAVRLTPETGAGGLAFHADGGNKHYGFYPSKGKMRLSRFMGADVFSWKVLYEEPTKHYRPGQWNTLKVRVEKNRLRCYVNDGLVIDSKDDGLTNGKIGLVKFRTTHVEFKNFRVGSKLKSLAPSAALAKKIASLTKSIPTKGGLDDKLIQKLETDAPASLAALRQRAQLLEKQAQRLRELANRVYQKKTLDQLNDAIKGKDANIPLIHAALLIAKLDNEELNVDAYVRLVERLARDIKKKIPAKANEAKRMEILKKELFARRGFHGSRTDYYNAANSYLNNVLDDREGLPITLSVLFMDVARRLDLNVEGVGLPGHFVVRHVPKKGKPYLIDVFEGGVKMSKLDAEVKVQGITGKPLEKEDLAPVGNKDILIRMLHNLGGVARDKEDLPGIIRYMDAILVINENLVDERLLRAAAKFQSGDKTGALADLDWLLDNSPPGLNRERVLQLRRLIRRVPR